MAIPVEDGTGSDPLAYAFVSAADIVSFAAARGVELEADDDLDVLIVKSTDFIVAQEPEFMGTRTNDDQPLPFPRSGLYLRKVEFAEDEIANEVVRLQCLLVIELSKGFDFFPSTNEAGLRSKQTGPLKKEWFSPGGGVGLASWSNPTIDAALAPLLSNQSGAALRVERV